MSKKLGKIMQKLTTVAIAFALVLSVMSPASALAAVTAPTLNETSITISVGKKFDFNVKEQVKGATYEWSVANDKVVAINQDGVVTGVGAGQTNVTCRMKVSGKVYRAIARVSVLKGAVKVAITNPVETLNVKDYYKLKAQITPATSNDYVTWTSSDMNIAKVDLDGSFVIRKEGPVTITATTISGRKDSVTIYVGAAALANKGKEQTPTDNSGDTNTGETVKSGIILAEDFATSVGAFVIRGNGALTHVKTAGAEGSNGYITITGRTSTWNGALVDLTDLVTPGKSYNVSAWVKYDKGEAVEVIKATQEDAINGTAGYPAISGEVTVNKGEWTKVGGVMSVDPNTSKCLLYFEATSLIDFYVDNIVVELAE